MPTQNAPASMYRSTEGLGVWEHKGKVAAVGIGHSPTARRWDETTDTSLGAWSILALRRAIEDAGVRPDEVDGLVMAQETLHRVALAFGQTHSRGFPQHLQVHGQTRSTASPRLSADWLLMNMPELSNVNFTMYGPAACPHAVVTAAQAVGEGLTEVWPGPQGLAQLWRAVLRWTGRRRRRHRHRAGQVFHPVGNRGLLHHGHAV